MFDIWVRKGQGAAAGGMGTSSFIIILNVTVLVQQGCRGFGDKGDGETAKHHSFDLKINLILIL